MPKMIQVVTGPLEGMSFIIGDGQSISLGRSSQNDVTLAYDPWISSTHGVLKNSKQTIYLMDLNSSNGSFINGKKIQANVFLDIREFFIIGSTLCRVSEPGRLINTHPLSLRREEAEQYLNHPLMNAAFKLTRERSIPMLGSFQLFKAVLDQEVAQVERFLKSLGMDIKRVRHRLEKLHVFDGDLCWINEFLHYQNRPMKTGDCFLTPLVQDLLSKHGKNGRFNPVFFLRLMLSDTYNLLFPLLDITENGRAEEDDADAERVTMHPYQSTSREIVLPTRFWMAFDQAMGETPIVLLTGKKGTGKTTILKQCFHALPKVDISYFKKGNKRIFDPKVFLVFNEPIELKPYLNQIIEVLNSDRIVAIDHFGYLVSLLEENGFDGGRLVNAINQRDVPLILAVAEEHLLYVRSLFEDAGTLRLDEYIGKVSKDIFFNLMADFQKETKCQISESARIFLKQAILPHYNFAAMEAFFEFCTEKIQSLSFLYSELSWSGNKNRTLSKIFFQEVLETWENPLDKRDKAEEESVGEDDTDATADDLQPPPIPEEIPGPPPSDIDTGPSGPTPTVPVGMETAFTAQVESILENFFTKHFGKEGIYSNFSGRVAEQGNLNLPQKQEEIRKHLEALLECLDPGFDQWFASILKEIDPKDIEKQPGMADNHEGMWNEFVYRVELMDTNYERGHFFNIAKKMFEKLLNAS